MQLRHALYAAAITGSIALLAGSALIAGSQTPSSGPTDAELYTQASIAADQAAALRDALGRRVTTTSSTAPTPSSTTTSSTAPPTTTTPAPTTTSSTAPPATTIPVVTPDAYGAKGDGTTDDSAALQRALDATTDGKVLTIPAGRTYAHSVVLSVNNAGAHIAGPGALLATAEATSSVRVAADRVTLDGGLTLRMGTTTKRWVAYEQMKLRVDGHTGLVVRNVTIDGSAAAGIYVGGADHYLLDHVTVQNTRADCIHQTGGSNWGQVVSPLVKGCGDDGVAVVSYSDQPVSHDIVVTDPVLIGQPWGRAFSVVGGQNITYRNVKSTGSAGAAVYVATEGSNYWDVSNVLVAGGTVDQSNSNATVGHGAVVVYNGKAGGKITGVTIQDLTITNTRAGAPRQVSLIVYGNQGASGIRFDRFKISGGPSSLWYTDSNGGYTRSAWTFNGAPVAGT